MQTKKKTNNSSNNTNNNLVNSNANSSNNAVEESPNKRHKSSRISQSNHLLEEPKTPAVVHPLTGLPDVPTLTDLQIFITEAIRFKSDEETKSCDFENIYEYVEKRWKQVKRRDGSSYTTDCRRAIQANLRMNPHHVALFRKDKNKENYWKICETMEEAEEANKEKQKPTTNKKSDKELEESIENENESSEKEETISNNNNNNNHVTNSKNSKNNNDSSNENETKPPSKKEKESTKKEETTKKTKGRKIIAMMKTFHQKNQNRRTNQMTNKMNRLETFKSTKSLWILPHLSMMIKKKRTINNLPIQNCLQKEKLEDQRVPKMLQKKKKMLP